MLKILKWFGRIALGLLAVFLLAAVVMFARFLMWRGEIEQGLARNSSVVDTPVGVVEYADTGPGTAVLLMLHGTPGGYDQVLSHIQATGSANSGARYIVPSRPGYLRTPLASGESPEQQAQLYAALLTKLGISRVFVIGASGGGPSALQFAIQYPERCSGLILEAAATQRIVVEQKHLPPILQDFLIFLFRKKAISDLQAKDPADPVISRLGEGVLASLVPASRRAAGQANDLQQFSQMEEWPLSSIRCPTLIVHGTLDKDVPIAHAEFAHAQIANSELVKIEGADHLMFYTRYKELDRLVGGFIAKHQ